MKPIIWQDRLCKTEGGLWMLSAVGDHKDWDFAPTPPRPGMAVAGVLPGEVVGELGHLEMVGRRLVASMRVIDEDRLLMTAADGTMWLMVGNPCGGGWIEQFTGELPPGPLEPDEPVVVESPPAAPDSPPARP